MESTSPAPTESRVAYVGVDLHKHASQLCLLGADGQVSERRIRTDPARFAAVLGGLPRAKVLVESSTESEWVAQCLEALGHDVVVADPTYAPMYATRSRRVKTDKRDARTLAEACRLGAYRPAHRASAERRHLRAQLAIRDALVRNRARCVCLARMLAHHNGLRIPTGAARNILPQLDRLALPAHLAVELAPLRSVVVALNTEIATADAALVRLLRDDPVARRLATVPGVGAVTAAAFVATVDDVGRFAGAHQLMAYLGLVPSEHSSGERQSRGRITKAGNTRMRWLLVEAAWCILRNTQPETARLRAWALAVAARRGKRVAAVALARRLAGILYALWRDDAVFDPVRAARVA